MEESTYKVFVRLNEVGNITAINSHPFLPNTDGWVQIDEGTGDRYHHAQGNYFVGGIYTDDGAHLYRWDGEQVVPTTLEEQAEEVAEVAPTPEAPTIEERTAALEAAMLEMMMGGVEHV